MLLRLDLLDQAEETISKAVNNLEPDQPLLLEFLGMNPEAYVGAVVAQIQMALGK